MTRTCKNLLDPYRNMVLDGLMAARRDCYWACKLKVSVAAMAPYRASICNVEWPKVRHSHAGHGGQAALVVVRSSPSGLMKNKKGKSRMLTSRIGLALAGALVIGASLIAIDPASAAGGCGPGSWRGPWGHCRDTPYTGPLPNGGYQEEFRASDNGCPSGYWRGPYGHCRNTPFHGRLPNGNWR